MTRALLAALFLGLFALSASAQVHPFPGPGVVLPTPGGGSPTFVDSITSETGASASAQATTTDWSVTPGNLLVAVCVIGTGASSNAPSFTDDDAGSGAWTTHVYQQRFSEYGVAIGTTVAGDGGTVTVTCTAGSGGVGQFQVLVAEFANTWATPTALNTVGTNTSSGTSHAIGDLTPGAGSDLLYLSALTSYGLLDPGATTAPADFTKDPSSADDATTGPPLALGYWVGSGTKATTWTTTNSVVGIGAGVVLGD